MTVLDSWEGRLIAEARRLSGKGGTGFLSSGELGEAARDLLVLQRGLTGDRRLIGSAYMDERKRLASYLLFYWPVSRAQIRGLMSMAFGNEGPGPDSEAPLRILDLGSGPAPCSIAAAEWLAAKEVRIVACDQSRLALESARRLAGSAGYGFTGIDGWDASSDETPHGPFGLIILGHLLNELWKEQDGRVERRHRFVLELLDKLAPGGTIVVLEPATHSASRDMLILRDLLVKSGLAVRAPCFRNGPCPALENEGQSCHSDFDWKANATVRELSRRTGLDKGLVKTTGFVFGGREDHPVPSRSYRVVSETMLNKAGRQRLLICGEEGRFPLSSKPGEGFPAEGVFRSLKRSDRIELSGAVKRESGLALGRETRIERLSPESR